MGHVIAGVEGVYDRHRYDEEKADALCQLANLIEQIIINTPNVVNPPERQDYAGDISRVGLAKRGDRERYIESAKNAKQTDLYKRQTLPFGRVFACAPGMGIDLEVEVLS